MDAAALARFLKPVLASDSEVGVEGLRRILGGSSRATWRLDAVYRAHGAERRRGLIVRMGASAYGDVLGGSAELEYSVYRALRTGSELPVPEALALERDPALLGEPFFVMERIDGCQSAPELLRQPAYAEAAPRIARELFRLGGALTRFDWRYSELPRVLEPVGPDDCWRRELAYWSAAIERCRRDAQPLVRLAIAWLEAHPPPPAQRVTLLSGDYRIGNVLYDESGTIHGWLDWEMAHLGDPLEDLAWALLDNWRLDPGGLFGGLGDREAIRIWQGASGLEVDPRALRWWSIFQHVKAQGIWQGAVRAYCDGITREPVQALIACSATVSQDRLLLAALGWNDAAR